MLDYNYHHSSQGGAPYAGTESNGCYDDLILSDAGFEPYLTVDTALFLESPTHSDSASPSPSSFPTMFNQQSPSQMYAMWQQYNTPVAAQSQEYDQQFTLYGYPDMNQMQHIPMGYDAGNAPQTYNPSYTTPQSVNHASVLSVRPRSQPSSPSSRSPRSYPPSPHSPASSSSSSSNATMRGRYPPPNTPTHPPVPPPVAPPAPPPAPAFILPHPQVVGLRFRIPQTLEVGNNNPRVEFKVRGARGIRVQDAIRQFENVDNGQDKVLARIGARTIRLSIHWPGCSPVGAYITVRDAGEPVTRQQFAHRVSAAIGRLLSKAARSQAQDTPFSLGTEGITLNHLWLEYVTQASQNMWIAELTTTVVPEPAPAL